MQIIEIKNPDKENCNSFVLDNQGEFLQSWEWGSFQAATGKVIWRLAVVGENDEFLAVALIIKHQLPLGKNYLYCSRGPVEQIINHKLQIINKTQIPNSKIQELIFGKIREIAKKENSVFLKWEPAVLFCHPELVSGSEKDRFRNEFGMTGHKVSNLQPRDTLILDLNKTEDELLAQMKQKTRYNIRLAEKHGVNVRISDEETFESDFKKFWSLTEETTSRDKFQSHVKEYYRKMLAFRSFSAGELERLTSKDEISLNQFSTKLFLAEFEGKILAANIMVFFGTRATYLHGASGAAYRNLMAPYLLQWEQIKKARQMGYKEYDFWGIASINQKSKIKNQSLDKVNYKTVWEGITRFKTGFGGREINYPEAVDIVYQPIVYKAIAVAKKAAKIFRQANGCYVAIEFFKKAMKILGLIFIVILIAIFSININVSLKSKQYIFSDIKKAPKAEVALILGAKVFNDGRLSDMLRDRADTAISLYETGKVNKILMSGDHGTAGYDEVNAVKKYLLEKGIRGEDIFLDYAGFDTYDSLYRAKKIFEAQSVMIVSQNFHLPRAVYIGRSLELEAYGISADTHTYGGIENNERREILADIKAFWDINLLAKPKFLGETIPLSGNGKKSWD